MKFRLSSLMLLILVYCAACGAQESKAFAWQQVETAVNVQRNGTLQVTEDLTIRYINGSFTFIQRDLPHRNLLDIDNITVRMDGRTFVRDTNDAPYTFSVESADGTDHVRMNYPATSSGTRTVRLQYDVTGAIRRDYSAPHTPPSANGEQTFGVQVWWSMVFPQRDQAVEHAIGRITLDQPVDDPDSITAEAPDVPGTIEKGNDGAVVTASDIPPGQELTLRVGFPKQVAKGEPTAFYGSTSKAANAAPPATNDDRDSLFSDPRIWFAILFLGAILIWNVYRWATGDYDETSDYDRGYEDGSRSWRHRSGGYRSSSGGSSGSGGGGSRGGGGGGSSGGGGGSVG